ncbi:MAG TPA: hypothetical protein VGK73_32755 [Polyangiaceae bacterium]
MGYLRSAHAYAYDLARAVEQRWGGAPGLPEPELLERLLSVCYQASLLRDEGRPVTFRIALADPEMFPAVAGPPAGLHRLLFESCRPFDEHELRRLTPVAGFHRSLVGVRARDPEFEVWGLVHSGPRWLQEVRGGRRIRQAIPEVLMVAVTGPGRVLVSKGPETIAALAGGTLFGAASDVFAASWLTSLFGRLEVAQAAEHVLSPDHRFGPHAPIEPSFGGRLAQHVLRRIVATIRGARHGGALIFLPAERASQICATGRILALKYPFADEEPRRRIFSLTVQIMNELARLYGRPGSKPAPAVGWTEYEASTDSSLAALDEALFEAAHLVGMLAEVDGAVVMTNRLEILGFGAEISGALPDVEFVQRSLDLEGTRYVTERADRVGSRHRSSYRLTAHFHDVFSIVVSQDGGVRFVRWHGGGVVYFDQVATGPWEV